MKVHIILAGLCVSALLVYMGGVDASEESAEKSGSSLSTTMSNEEQSADAESTESVDSSIESTRSEGNSTGNGGSDGSGSDGTGGSGSGEIDGSGNGGSDGGGSDGTGGSGSDGTGGSGSDGTDGSGNDGTGGSGSDGTSGTGNDGTGGSGNGGTGGNGNDGTGGNGNPGTGGTGNPGTGGTGNPGTGGTGNPGTGGSGNGGTGGNGNPGTGGTGNPGTGGSGDGGTGCNKTGGPKNRKVGETCTPGLCNACADEHAVCVLDCGDANSVAQYVCRCDYGYGVEDECGICVESNITCAKDDDCPDLKVCGVDHECVCPEGYLLAEDGHCYGTLYMAQCSETYDTCSASHHLICRNGYCNCSVSHPEYDSETNTCYQCLDSCEEENMSCLSGICTCDSPYILVGQVCVGRTYNSPCITPHDTCSMSENLICAGDKCDCNPSSYTWDDSIRMCVGELIDEPCSPSKGCSDPNALCKGKCACVSPYENVGGVCVIVAAIPANYSDPCDDTHKCVDPNNVCNGTTCVCNNNSVYDSSLGECVILLHAPCESQTDTCKDQSATCQQSSCGFSCQCKAGFVPENPDVCGGACIKQQTEGETCNDSVKNICTPVTSTTCVKRICRSIYKYLGEQCECDQCVPQGNMYCNMALEVPVCACLQGFWPAKKICFPALR